MIGTVWAFAAMIAATAAFPVAWLAGDWRQSRRSKEA